MLSSEGCRKRFSDTTKEKFSCDTLNGAMSGFAGSGKSHTLALMTGQLPPSLRISTALYQTPTRTITHTMIGVDGEGTFAVISSESYTDTVLLSAYKGRTVWAKAVKSDR